MVRDYVEERRAYYGYGKAADQTATQRRHRKEKAARNAARALMKKKGKVRADQDVDHRNGNPQDNRAANLQTTSVSYNRGTKNRKK